MRGFAQDVDESAVYLKDHLVHSVPLSDSKTGIMSAEFGLHNKLEKEMSSSLSICLEVELNSVSMRPELLQYRVDVSISLLRHGQPQPLLKKNIKQHM